MSQRPLCLIPARGGSKRLARKNVAPLCGKPLIAYSIEAALESGVFDKVIVSTEDEEIAAVARENGATVPFFRPAALAADDVRVVYVCLHALDYFAERGHAYDTLCVLLATSPLRTAADVRQAYDKFVARDADFLMATTEYLYSPFQALREEDGWLKRMWDESYYRTRSQDLPAVQVDNGAIYLARVDALRREENFVGERTVGFLMPLERSIDVDHAATLSLAEHFLQCQKAAAGKT